MRGPEGPGRRPHGGMGPGRRPPGGFGPGGMGRPGGMRPGGPPPPPPPRRRWGGYRGGCMPGCLMYILGTGGIIALLVMGITALF